MLYVRAWNIIYCMVTLPRLWYAGPAFRHERPQKGRYRQFYQLSLEVLGLPGPDVDIELILIYCALMGCSWH